MVLAHNLTAMNAQRQYNIVGTSRKKSTEKLSSGYRINRAADDAAGLQISEKLRSQIRGLTQASSNCQDGISLCQIADGALTETHSMLQRLNELCVKSANGTNTDADRAAIQAEVEQLTGEFDRIASSTSFNAELFPLRGRTTTVPLEEKTVKLTLENGGKVNGVTYNPGDTVSLKTIAIKGASTFVSTNLQLGEGSQVSGNLYSTAAVVDTYDLKRSDLFESPEGNLGFKKPDGDTWYIRETNNALVMTKNKNASGLITFYDMSVSVHAGANSSDKQSIPINFVDATKSGLKLTEPEIDVSTKDGALEAIDRVKNAIDITSGYRSYFGATQNRLEHTIANLDNIVENTQNAESNIRDTDMAAEVVNNTKMNILEQAVTSMMSQANQAAQGVLTLLQ